MVDKRHITLYFLYGHFTAKAAHEQFICCHIQAKAFHVPSPMGGTLQL